MLLAVRGRLGVGDDAGDRSREVFAQRSALRGGRLSRAARSRAWEKPADKQGEVAALSVTDRIVDAVRGASGGYRARRLAAFAELLEVRPGMRILDVGGGSELWLARPELVRGVDLTILNLDPPEAFLAASRAALGEALSARWQYVQGDGRALPYDDGAFDVVFSNSVIEHVGDWDDQRRFAAEVRRVGRSYWLQTPNRRFIVEPHFNVPGLQFLPPAVAERVAIAWPFSFLKRYGHGSPEQIRAALRSTRLLTLREFRALFPDARILRERMAGLDKSFVAYRRAL